MKEDELTRKWLNNELSAAENEQFQQLDDAEFNTFIVDYANHFKASDHQQLSDFGTFNKRYDKHRKSFRKLNWSNQFLKIASIVVIALGVYFTLFYKSETKIETIANATKTVILPDNSIVEINQLSKLTYVESDWKKNRSLNLYGEAYFDVEKGKRFKVLTDYGNVSVLGTEFNVISRDSVFKVSCYEGLVQVTYNGNNVKLPAGSEFYLEDGKFLKSSTALKEPYWLKNMSIFENASLLEVLKDLEKHYSINVTYPTDLNIKFTGAYEHNDLQKALKSITDPLNLTYEIQNSNTVILRNE